MSLKSPNHDTLALLLKKAKMLIKKKKNDQQ